MSYTRAERDKAILAIGKGNVLAGNIAMYEQLELFNWVYIKRSKGEFQSVSLTYSGKELFTQLEKDTI